MSNIEYRAVIKFLTKESLTPTQINERMRAVYGDSCPSFATIKHWSKLFRWGRESLEDDPRAGGPTTVTTTENIEFVEQIVLSDRRLKAKEIAAQTGISKTSVLRILHEHLGMSKISARWVPKLLSAVQKQRRVECCQQFLELCRADQKKVIESIVTGDETMVLYYDPTSKRDSMEWHRKGEPAPKKARVSQSTKKVMATIFWDCEGILLIDFKEKNTVVNASYYSDLLRQLRQKIIEKRRGKISRGIRLLHDNAPVHTAAISKATIQECGFMELDHPPYSPDLAPSDYFLFSKLKSELRGKKFNDDDEIKQAVNAHFEGKDSTYFYSGIEALVKRCEKCIQVKGDYIEK
jgi:histone-lysine N-methyltransferase SETMAR